MTTHVIFCIMPIHGHCTLMYPGLLYVFVIMCRVVSLYSADWMAGSSTGFFITSLLGWAYNLFRPSYHPSNLTHQGASVIVDFTTPGESHSYGLPCPFVDSLTSWTIFVPLMFPISSLKTCKNFHTRLLNPLSHIYVVLTPKTTYIGMCEKGKILLEFSLMWI